MRKKRTVVARWPGSSGETLLLVGDERGDVRLAMLVVVLVVLAGCSGVTVVDRTTETVTPAPVPAPQTETETGDDTLPPGVSGRGVTNVHALVRAHQSATSDMSYTWRVERVTNTSTPGRENLTTARHVAHVENASVYDYWTNHRTVQRGGRTRYLGNYTEFTDPSGRHVKYEDTEENTQYRKTEPVRAHVRIGDESTAAIDHYLDADDARLAVVLVDGERYYKLRGRNATFATTEPVENYTVEALVRPDGFVRAVTVNYRIGQGEQRRSITYRYEYTAIGNTTVDRPNWVERQWYDEQPVDSPRATETTTTATETD